MSKAIITQEFQGVRGIFSLHPTRALQTGNYKELKGILWKDKLSLMRK